MRALTWSATLLLLFLAGCSGNGVQYARIANETLSTTGSVFIGRESQWIGSAISVEVQLNGKPIAVLAQGQAVSSMAKAGENIVTIIPTGPARLIYDSRDITFNRSGDDNIFILVRVNEAIPGFGGEIRVVETESKIFAAAVGN
ncbi:MAG: hypothetical protein L7U42_06500 [Candidatus Nanopelagicales bacterium]|nr:hypothetical protein [Candidatus Nanopelagicales bacterium]